MVINGNKATCAGPGRSSSASPRRVQLSVVINGGRAAPEPDRRGAPEASPGKAVMDVGSPWPRARRDGWAALPAMPCHAMVCRAVLRHARRLHPHCPAAASSALQDASRSGTGSQSIPIPVQPPRRAPDTDVRPGCHLRDAPGSPAWANSEVTPPRSSSPPLLLSFSCRELSPASRPPPPAPASV